ncbi:MAG TPA: hypothetical protein VF974_03510 [Patescibacteria group bacterium]
MKIIIYYLILLIFIALLTGFLLQQHSDGMSMPTMLSISVLLSIYVVAMSMVGEGKTIDEREVSHRYIANRSALMAGTVFFSIGILYQLFTNNLDYWLLSGLIMINLIKIVSFIYSNYKH